MNGLAILGLVLILYAVMVFWIVIKKPDKLWNMSKIELFKKVLGEKGAVIFFYIWGIVFAGIGIWLLIK